MLHCRVLCWARRCIKGSWEVRVDRCDGVSVFCPVSLTLPCLANMKKLILRHKDSVSKFSKLDFEAIQKVTYLYEFDREVQ